jgi:hypothetical protein
MAGRLAPASEVAGGHTLPFYKGHGLPILVWQVLLRHLRLELDCQDQVQTIVTRALN